MFEQLDFGIGEGYSHRRNIDAAIEFWKERNPLKCVRVHFGVHNWSSSLHLRSNREDRDSDKLQVTCASTATSHVLAKNMEESTTYTYLQCNCICRSYIHDFVLQRTGYITLFWQVDCLSSNFDWNAQTQRLLFACTRCGQGHQSVASTHIHKANR